MFAPCDNLGQIFLPSPANTDHPLCPDHWWLALPGLDGGRCLYDIGGSSAAAHGTLTNMGSGSGWKPTTRMGGWGELGFDGSNDWVAVPSLALGTVHTVSFWMNYRDAGDAVLVGSDNLAFSYAPYITGPGAGALIYYEASSGGGNVVHGGFTSGQWYHIAVVRNGTTVTFYKNALSLGSISIANNPFLLTSLGASPNGSFPFQGSLDAVKIHSRALSPAEIPALMRESLLGYPGMLRRVRPVIYSTGSAAALFRRNAQLRAGSRGAWL